MNGAMVFLFFLAASVCRTSGTSSVVMPASTSAMSGLPSSSPLQVSPSTTTASETSTPSPSSSGTSISSVVLETPTLHPSIVGSSGTLPSFPSTTPPSPEAKMSTSQGLISPSSSSGVGSSSSESVGLHPCAVNNAGCEDKCEQVGATYKCLCEPGYALGSDKHRCTDVDECAVQPVRHNCTHKCVNTIGSYACACKPGFKLQMDGFTCELKVSTKPASQVESPHAWTWIILGIVVGLVIFIILILMAGVISKASLKSTGKENFLERSGHEMKPVEGSPVTGTLNKVEVEP